MEACAAEGSSAFMATTAVDTEAGVLQVTDMQHVHDAAVPSAWS
jgi:hypothetical protein